MNHLALELKKYTDAEILNKTFQIAKQEQKMTIEVLYHLHEINRRSLSYKEIIPAFLTVS